MAEFKELYNIEVRKKQISGETTSHNLKRLLPIFVIKRHGLIQLSRFSFSVLPSAWAGVRVRKAKMGSKSSVFFVFAGNKSLLFCHTKTGIK